MTREVETEQVGPVDTGAEPVSLLHALSLSPGDEHETQPAMHYRPPRHSLLGEAHTTPHHHRAQTCGWWWGWTQWYSTVQAGL